MMSGFRGGNLHCDPTASHYLKLLMDSVFGSGNFRNEIIWRRGTGVSRTVAKQFLRNHDTLLCYSNGATWTYSRQLKPYSKATLAMFKHDDKDGRGSYRLQELRTYGKETRSRLRGENRIIESKTGREYLKQYLQEKPGNTVDSIWGDVGTMNTQGSPERIGYPTQKPLALLERIIKASSNEGDVVLDPFCGCATACVAADKLGRRWVGIDISPKAGELVNMRLQQAMGSLFHHGYVTARTDIPRRTDIDAPKNYRQNKHVLFGQQEGLCNGCGVMFPFRNFTVDHMVPQSRGGTDHLDNLQLLCGACNSVKGDRSQEHLIARLKEMAI